MEEITFNTVNLQSLTPKSGGLVRKEKICPTTVKARSSAVKQNQCKAAFNCPSCGPAFITFPDPNGGENRHVCGDCNSYVLPIADENTTPVSANKIAKAHAKSSVKSTNVVTLLIPWRI